MKYIQIFMLGLICVMPIQSSETPLWMQAVGSATGFIIGAVFNSFTPEHLKAPAIIAAQKAKIIALEEQAACQNVKIIVLENKVVGLTEKSCSSGFKNKRRASV